MLQLSVVRRAAMADLLETTRHTPSFLRHMPPTVYLTCDFAAARRHATLLVDASAAPAPPLSRCAYVLSSSAAADERFCCATSVLFGVPSARDAAAAAAFADGALPRALSRGGLSVPRDGLAAVVLPEFDPFAGHAVAALRERLPALSIACGPLTAAFLSDRAFFAEAQRALGDRNGSDDGAFAFANVPASALRVVRAGDAAIAVSEGRELRPAAAAEGNEGNEDNDDAPLFLYDAAFRAVLAGASAVGARCAFARALCPTGGGAAAERPVATARAADGPGAAAFQSPFRPAADARRAARALRDFPDALRVLALEYGEAPGGPGACAARLGDSAARLERLRARLARRLATDTERDMRRWSRALEEKMIAEIFPQEDTQCGGEAASAMKEWMRDAFLARTARALAWSAATVPIEEEYAEPSQSEEEGKKTAQKKDRSASEGSKSVQSLQGHFERHGMGPLAQAIAREEIDVEVFLAMSQKELKTVFKATFGVVKKMELLQDELRGATKKN